MKMKKCKGPCQTTKPLSDFYKQKQMADGHLNKCKRCICDAVTENRNKHIDYYRKYDRERGLRQGAEYFSEYKKKYPAKYKARNMVNNAIRDGKMKKECCEVCGAVKAHAHHDDYAYPLTVRWLCAAHHKQWHRENGPGINGGNDA